MTPEEIEDRIRAIRFALERGRGNLRTNSRLAAMIEREFLIDVLIRIAGGVESPEKVAGLALRVTHLEFDRH